MFAVVNRLTRSRSISKTESPAPRRAAFEPLEDRRLYSMSSGGDYVGVPQPTAVERPPAVHRPAVQRPTGNIIAILIGL